MPIEIPDDRLDIQCLIQALSEYVEAKTAHDKALATYDGYSWGYHGQKEINRMHNAAVAFGYRLDDYIDARIKAEGKEK